MAEIFFSCVNRVRRGSSMMADSQYPIRIMPSTASHHSSHSFVFQTNVVSVLSVRSLAHSSLQILQIFVHLKNEMAKKMILR